MMITLPDEIARAVDALARASGETAERLVVSALRAHFPPIDAELQAEFDAWDRASEVDALRL